MHIERVLVIGAGTMGSGIAQWFVQQGCQVELVDINAQQTKNAEKKLHESWDKLATKGKFTANQVATFKQNLAIASYYGMDDHADLIVEAAVEKLEIKKEIFSEFNHRMNANCIFASNTSSFPIELLCEHLPEERKKMFLGLHFFNPAPIMKLVEVISSKYTDPEIAQGLYQWFDDKGKKPALCKDSPGFIVNRVARNFYGEALRIAEENDQKKFKQIDNILKNVAGFRMGPYELMDLIGIDVNYDVTCSVWQAFNQVERFAPHELQKYMVDNKRLGKKTNKGFYDYE